MTPDAELSCEYRQDQELLEGCRGGSLPAFERLFQKHGPQMKSIAMNLLGNVSDAEDAVQDAFLKIYHGLPEFRGDSAFSTWIFRLLVNTCHDLARKRRRLPLSILSADGREKEASANALDHPLRLTLERMLRRLDSRTRTVFVLFEVEGFSHREIASIMDIPEGTSKALLFEAKRKLQRWIKENT